MLRIVARPGLLEMVTPLVIFTCHILAHNRPCGFPPSRSILSGNMRVQLLRTCCRHVMGAVSCLFVCLFVCLSCVGAGREPYCRITIALPAFTVDALPKGFHYAGPYKTQAADLCLCNTIAYSLLSACDGMPGIRMD